MKRESYFTVEERTLTIYKRAFAEGYAEGLEEARAVLREEEVRRVMVQAVLVSLRGRGLEPSVDLLIALQYIQDQDRLLAILERAGKVESATQLLVELSISVSLEPAGP